MHLAVVDTSLARYLAVQLRRTLGCAPHAARDVGGYCVEHRFISVAGVTYPCRTDNPIFTVAPGLALRLQQGYDAKKEGGLREGREGKQGGTQSKTDVILHIAC